MNVAASNAADLLSSLAPLAPVPVLGALAKILAGLVLVVFVLIALLMTFVILIQEGKGGGIAGAFGGAAAESFGVKAGSVNRFTAWLAGLFIGLSVVYVTHDQQEALAVSDLVVVMKDGRIAQKGTPTELYDAPADAFVADFMGEANVLQGEVLSVADGRGCVAVCCTQAGSRRTGLRSISLQSTCASPRGNTTMSPFSSRTGGRPSTHAHPAPRATTW